MTELLLAIEGLVATLSLLALVIGWYVRGRRSWLRFAGVLVANVLLVLPWVFVLMVVVLVSLPGSIAYSEPVALAPAGAGHPPAPGPMATFFSAVGRFFSGLTFGTVTCAVLLLVVCVGSWILWRRGLGPRGAREDAPAATWPLKRIALAALVAAALVQSTIWMRDAEVRERLVEVRQDAAMIAATVAPERPLAEDNAAPLYYQIADAMGEFRHVDWYERLDAKDEEEPINPDNAPEQPGVPDFRTKYWFDVVNANWDGELELKSPRLAAFLERNRGVRDLIIEAAAKPACDFDHDLLNPSLDMRLDELNWFRSVARFLAIDARQAAATGDDARAAEDLRAMYQVAGQAVETPTFVNVLVAIAIESTANETCASILANHPSRSDPLLEFEPPDSPRMGSVFMRALRWEEAFGLTLLTEFARTWTMHGSGIVDEPNVAMARAFGPLMRIITLEPWANDMRSTYAEMRRAIAKSDQEEGDQATTIADLERIANEPNHTILIRLLMPAVSACQTSVARSEAARNCTKVGLALYRYYHGSEPKRFPDSLDALVPEYLDYVPTDRFDGGPLKYKLTDRGCVVYSIGANERDDGGVEFDEDGQLADYVFECIAPPAEGEPDEPKQDSP